MCCCASALILSEPFFFPLVRKPQFYSQICSCWITEGSEDHAHLPEDLEGGRRRGRGLLEAGFSKVGLRCPVRYQVD